MMRNIQVSTKLTHPPYIHSSMELFEFDIKTVGENFEIQFSQLDENAMDFDYVMEFKIGVSLIWKYVLDIFIHQIMFT